MTPKIEVKGMLFAETDSPGRPYELLAYAEVSLPELRMQIRGVSLTWSKERGFLATAPFVRKKSGTAPSLVWHHDSDFARNLALRMADMYVRMGGTLPVGSEPDQSGLHRVLGIDPAIAETCDHAGL